MILKFQTLRPHISLLSIRTVYTIGKASTLGSSSGNLLIKGKLDNFNHLKLDLCKLSLYKM